MKKKQNKGELIPALSAVLLVMAIITVVALAVPKEGEKGEFVPPAFEENALVGTPEVPEGLGYRELHQDGMAYRVSTCGIVLMEQENAVVYFTNDESNEVYLKLRVTDTDGNILGESGLIRPGEYLRSVTLTKVPAAGTQIRLKVMSYDPETYESMGSVVLRVTVQNS